MCESSKSNLSNKLVMRIYCSRCYRKMGVVQGMRLNHTIREHETAEGLRGRGFSSLGDAHRMMHVLWTENDLSAATDDIGCTERSLS